MASVGSTFLKNQQILSYFFLVGEVKLAIASGEWRIIYYYIITCKYLWAHSWIGL